MPMIITGCSRHPTAFSLDSMRNLDYEQGEHLWPDINYAQICAYFLDKVCHDGSAAQAFRALDAYQYVKSGMCNLELLVQEMPLW